MDVYIDGKVKRERERERERERGREKKDIANMSKKK